MNENRFEDLLCIQRLAKWLREESKGKLSVSTLQETAFKLYKIIELTEMCENIRTVRGGKTFLIKATQDSKRILKQIEIKFPSLEQLKQIAQYKD